MKALSTEKKRQWHLHKQNVLLPKKWNKHNLPETCFPLD